MKTSLSEAYFIPSLSIEMKEQLHYFFSKFLLVYQFKDS